MNKHILCLFIFSNIKKVGSSPLRQWYVSAVELEPRHRARFRLRLSSLSCFFSTLPDLNLVLISRVNRLHPCTATTTLDRGTRHWVIDHRAPATRIDANAIVDARHNTIHLDILLPSLYSDPLHMCMIRRGLQFRHLRSSIITHGARFLYRARVQDCRASAHNFHPGCSDETLTVLLFRAASWRTILGGSRSFSWVGYRPPGTAC